MTVSSSPKPRWKPGELRVLVVDDEQDVRLGLRLLAEMVPPRWLSLVRASPFWIERNSPRLRVCSAVPTCWPIWALAIPI